MRDSTAGPTDGGEHRFFAGLDVVDRATMAYHAAVLLIPGLASLILGLPVRSFIFNLFALLFVPALEFWCRGRRSPWLRFIRDFYPMFFLLPIYEQVGGIDHVFIHGNLDALLGRMDFLLFGCEPARALSRMIRGDWFSEFMHFAYSTFYVTFPIVAIFLARSGKTRIFRRYMVAIFLAFYACDFLFIFLPALGPNALPGAIPPQGGLFFTPLMRFIYRFEIPGGAIPSSHVAVTIVVLGYAAHLERGRILIWISGISLILSTVYCGYHYAVDVLGGIVIGLAALAVAKRMIPPSTNIQNPGNPK